MEIIRTKYLDWLDKEKDRHFIKILTGIRRSGKSTTLIQFINQLKTVYKVKSNRIIYYDFNDAKLRKKYNWESLLDEIESKADTKSTNYLFLDEIQDIPNFEDVVITLFEHKTLKFDIYLTGSNSYMFSKNMVTFFTGRTVELNVLPLSFNEIYTIFKSANQSDEYIDRFYAEAFLQKYILQGGLGILVDSYNDLESNKNYLRGIVKDTIAKDIENRHNLKKDTTVLEKLIIYAFEHVGRDINSKRIENYFLSNEKAVITNKTIINYLTWLTDSQIMHKIKYFDVRGLKTLSSNSMYYAGDLGLLSSVIGFDINRLKGYRLENLVFLELLFRGYEVETGFDKNKNSVDFIAKKENERIYIQVTDQLNEENEIREYKTLLLAKNATRKIILTNAVNVPRKDNGVVIVFLIDWLLGKVNF
ncbi:MAG: ATP-binding protein [Mycoplasmataceae bacterium]|nr:ATP-binding protein [Mycoplasmataceae bacterium]